MLDNRVLANDVDAATDEVKTRGRRARAALAQQDADKVDAERYRAWRDAACKNDRTLIDAMFEYQQMHFKDGTPTPEQFNAGIDYALAAIDAARKEQA